MISVKFKSGNPSNYSSKDINTSLYNGIREEFPEIIGHITRNDWAYYYNDEEPNYTGYYIKRYNLMDKPVYLIKKDFSKGRSLFKCSNGLYFISDSKFEKYGVELPKHLFEI